MRVSPLLMWKYQKIAMAYEARSHFPDRTIHITNEIIHNPEVNYSACMYVCMYV